MYKLFYNIIVVIFTSAVFGTEIYNYYANDNIFIIKAQT